MIWRIGSLIVAGIGKVLVLVNDLEIGITGGAVVVVIHLKDV